MKKKRISAFFLTIALLSGSLSSTAYAATWYMEDGDVIVSASESGQTVSQNNNTIGDNDPTFTNRDSSVASDSTITIKTSDDATANITIEDINLKHSQESAIDVKDDSKANITVRGTNTIDRRDESSPSMIHVSDGDLTLRGDGSLTLSGRTDGAKIGSNGHSGDTGQGEEDFTGSIHITDDVTISATREYYNPSDTGSAAIGSGEKGNFTGTITIDGKEIESCGDTCVFVQNGLEPEVDFSLDEVNSNGGNGITDNAALARVLNRYKNDFGKSRVVVIKSQLGQPIAAFSGDNVYWEIPDDLPKMTKLMVDGKALYIHRANYQIIDKDLL